MIEITLVDSEGGAVDIYADSLVVVPNKDYDPDMKAPWNLGKSIVHCAGTFFYVMEERSEIYEIIKRSKE